MMQVEFMLSNLKDLEAVGFDSSEHRLAATADIEGKLHNASASNCGGVCNASFAEDAAVKFYGLNDLNSQIICESCTPFLTFVTPKASYHNFLVKNYVIIGSLLILGDYEAKAREFNWDAFAEYGIQRFAWDGRPSLHEGSALFSLYEAKDLFLKSLEGDWKKWLRSAEGLQALSAACKDPDSQSRYFTYRRFKRASPDVPTTSSGWVVAYLPLDKRPVSDLFTLALMLAYGESSPDGAFLISVPAFMLEVAQQTGELLTHVRVDDQVDASVLDQASLFFKLDTGDDLKALTDALEIAVAL